MINKIISIHGLGYIGLPTAALLTEKNFKVQGVDTNEKIVNKINDGSVHILEPGLQDIITKSIDLKLLSASIDSKIADIYIIAVPTPLIENKEIFEPDISHVLDVAKDISPLLKKGDIVILESTSPIGTTKKILEIFQQRTNVSESIYVAYCPERVIPGNIISELVNNDRVVGGVNKESTRIVADFYRIFVEGAVVETNSETAEMCKLSENSFRDINIAFANELSLLADNLNIDINELIRITNLHPRVNIHQPGIGVGGHCIAIDPWFLYYQDPQNSKLIKAAREINTNKTEWIQDKIRLAVEVYFEKNNIMPRISIFGLTYKPDTDDLRNSPACKILKNLQETNKAIMIVDPNVSIFENTKTIGSQEAIIDSDIIIFLVKHKEFADQISTFNFKNKIILDFVGIT